MDLEETTPLSDASSTEDASTAPTEDSEGFSVLQAFGLELKVSNRHLAGLLSMEARDALTTDLGELGALAGMDDAEDAEAQAAAKAAEERRAERRAELGGHVAATGAALGFDVGAGNVWRSQSGISVAVRPIESDVTLVTASRVAKELVSSRKRLAGSDSSILFVTDGQQAADVFSVAIRGQGFHDRMRTLSAANLDRLLELSRAGLVGHSQVLMLLTPIADVDAGEIISVLTASAAQPPPAMPPAAG